MMNKRMKKLIAMFALVAILASVALVPIEVSAANDFYGDYTDVAKIYDYGSCPSLQGLAVGSQKLYAIKIGGNDDKAFISMTDKDSGSTVKLYNADDNSYFFTYLDHANDMDVWGIDGYSNIFVATTKQGANGIIRLKRDGNNLNKVATYHLKCNGEDICATAMGIVGVSDGKIHFITKWAMQLYTGSVDVNATNATIEMTEFCSITKSRVYIKGEYLDLSNFVNQGMGYHDGTLFVPISGDDSQLNRSVIMVFDLNNATPGSTVYPTEALVFRVTSSAYSALCEFESCDICSGDGKLYFGVQRRKTNSDTDHDGIAYFDGYTYSRLPADAPTSKPTGYTVRYDANGGSGTMADTAVIYGVTSKLRTNTFTRNGWDFAGWHAYRTTQDQWYYTNGSDTGWYKEGSQPSGYTKHVYTDGVGVAKTSAVDGDLVIMYAQWTPKDITYTIHYNANGGTGTMEDTVVVYGYGTPLRKNTFTRDGYKFIGWTAYRTNKGQWYYGDGTDSGWYKEGSQPSGWTKEIYSDGVSVAATTSVDKDVVQLYAQWELVGYTVTFKDADGTVLSSAVYTPGATVTQPAAPTKAYDSTNHYTFSGWDKTVTAANSNTTYTATYKAAAHSYTSKVTKAATCTAEGTKTYTCSCGRSYTEKIAAAGHKYSSKVTAPTCTAGGYTTYTCSVCNDSYKSDITEATGHSYKSTVTKPTCSSGGYTTYTCTECNDSYQGDATQATGHNYKSTVTKPTCTAQGYTTYTCQDCGTSYKGSYTNALGHQYTSVVTAPTCTAGGYTTYTCSGCGHSYRDNLTNPAGHSYKTTVVAPTCINGGYTVYICACGDTYTSNQTNPTGHSYKTTTVAATCTENGSVTKTCSACGDKQIQTLPATGHSYTSKVVAPTCLKGGYTTFTCSSCGHSYQDRITNPTGHSYTAKVTAATCTEKGYTTYTCHCGDTYTDDQVAALGHSFANGACTVCGAADPNYEEPVVKPTLTLKSPTLEFKDMITVNAMFTAENIEDVVEMGMITYKESVETVSVDTADHVVPGTTYDQNTGRYIAHSQGIHAKYLGDTVYLACYAKLTDGSYVYTKLAPYSPVQYAASQLKNSSDVKLKQLVAAMLNYGAEAQLFFGHNVENLANASLTEEQKALPESYREDMVNAVPAASAEKQGIFANNKGFSKRYPAISFEGAFCINYFFKPNYTPVGDITLYYWKEADFAAADVLTAENASGSMTLAPEDSGEYRGDILGISAKSLSEAVYVAAVYSDGTTTWTSGVLGYSIGAYCSGQSAKGAEVAALAEATAVYGYHAKAYFG